MPEMKIVTPQDMKPLSLARFLAGTPEERQQIGRDCLKMLEDFNFLAIKDDRMPTSMMDDGYALTKKLFDLPMEAKQTYKGMMRGYMPFGIEKALRGKSPDAKEMWHMGPLVPRDHRLVKEYPFHYEENRYTAEVPKFREEMDALYSGFSACADTVLEILATGTGVPVRTWADTIKDAAHTFRLIHYPPITDEDLQHERERAVEHTGAGMIGIMPPATDPGLQIINRQGQWQVPVGFEGYYTVFMADMMERLSNDHLPGSLHRVVNPDVATNRARWAIVFFVVPRPDVKLDAPAELVTTARPRKYRSVTADAFLTDRMEAVQFDGKSLSGKVTWYLRRAVQKITGTVPDHKGKGKVMKTL